jgi:hypothetical protein
MIAEWKFATVVTLSDEKIARLMLDNFSAEAMSLPFFGEHKVRHYFEKVLWLIQSYCLEGWKNPVKGINHLDNGIIVIHPGTNRCVAAKFLGCDTLSVLVNINRSQRMFTTISNAKIIKDESTLRNSLISNGPILWRTENQEELWINGILQQDKYYKDFTYEFLDKDAWPNPNKLNQWIEIVYDMLPLTVYVDNAVNIELLKSKINNMNGLTFKSTNLTKKYKSFTCDFVIVANREEINSQDSWIYLGPNSNFYGNIFELLFFINPLISCSRTANNSIFIKNNKAGQGELIIPQHYVNNKSI